MQNNLPEKYENSFFIKIKRFLINILIDKTSTKEPKNITQNKKEVEVKYNEFERMKDASNKSKIKEDILGMVRENPSLIDTLPLERLKQLNLICDARLEELDRNIKRLEREIN